MLMVTVARWMDNVDSLVFRVWGHCFSIGRVWQLVVCELLVAECFLKSIWGFVQSEICSVHENNVAG